MALSHLHSLQTHTYKATLQFMIRDAPIHTSTEVHFYFKVPSSPFTQTRTTLPKAIIKSLLLSTPSSPGEKPRHWNLIKDSMSRAQMKLSHQSRSWDRMTQINKAERFGGSQSTPGSSEPPGRGLDQSVCSLGQRGARRCLSDRAPISGPHKKIIINQISSSLQLKTTALILHM